MLRGSIPPTGLPLPSISAGSTSIMIFMSMLGVVQNFEKQCIFKVKENAYKVYAFLFFYDIMQS